MGVPPVKKWAAPISFFLTTGQSGFVWYGCDTSVEKLCIVAES